MRRWEKRRRKGRERWEGKIEGRKEGRMEEEKEENKSRSNFLRKKFIGGGVNPLPVENNECYFIINPPHPHKKEK